MVYYCRKYRSLSQRFVLTKKPAPITATLTTPSAAFCFLNQPSAFPNKCRLDPLAQKQRDLIHIKQSLMSPSDKHKHGGKIRLRVRHASPSQDKEDAAVPFRTIKSVAYVAADEFRFYSEQAKSESINLGREFWTQIMQDNHDRLQTSRTLSLQYNRRHCRYGQLYQN